MNALIEATALARAGEAAPARCLHCGESLAGPGWFCCAGCASAYRLIGELGLKRYYRGRSLDPAARPPRPPEDAVDATCYAAASPDGTAALHLMIDGLHCPACVWLIESALRRQPR